MATNPFEGYRSRKGRGQFKIPSSGGNPFQSLQNQITMMNLKEIVKEQNRSNAPNLIEQARESLPNKQFTPGSQVNITDQGADVRVPLNIDMTLDESRAAGMSDAFDAHVKFLEDQMNNNPNFSNKFKKATMHFGGDKHQRGQVFGIPTTWGDKEAQLIGFAIQDMADRVLRLRSGAQINEQEFDRLMGLLPSFVNITDPSDTNYEVIRTKLLSFKNEVNNIKNRLQMGGNYNPTVWENFEGVNRNNLSHPAYQQYLSEQNKKNQSGNDDPLGMFQ